jgi:hypothetical protein
MLRKVFSTITAETVLGFLLAKSMATAPPMD